MTTPHGVPRPGEEPGEEPGAPVSFRDGGGGSAMSADYGRPTDVGVPVPAGLGDEGDEVAEATTRRLAPLLATVLVLVVVGGVIDLILDRPTHWLSVHVAFEVGIILLSLGFSVVLWRGWWVAERDLRVTAAALAATTRSLAERQAAQEAWRAQAEAERTGFGRAIDAQFAAWGLTPTEREVAFLLLQGHGHKQIAGRTGRSERTVRQHAVSVYQKSGIGGRAELAAFFLQDLLPDRASPPSR